jgi:hypothetical protein
MLYKESQLGDAIGVERKNETKREKNSFHKSSTTARI